MHDATHHKALELLARREHSQFELRQKLSARGFLCSQIEPVLADLAQAGLQSDQRFIEAYLHQRSGAGYGPKQIKLELRRRGIMVFPELVLDEENDYWQQILVTVWRKKFAVLPQDDKDYTRQMRFLLYRGFAMVHIKQLLQRGAGIE